MLAVVLGDARRARRSRAVDVGARLLDPGEPGFELADRGQVLVELAAVVGPSRPLSWRASSATKSRMLLRYGRAWPGPRPTRRRAAGEEALEDEPGVDLLGHRRRWPTARRCSTSRRSYSPSRSCPPGPRGRSPAPARRTGCALPTFSAATWSTETPTWMSAPSVFERLDAGQEGGERPGVVAGAVAVGRGRSSWARPVRTSRSSLNGGQRLEDLGQLEVRALGLRASRRPCGRRWGRRRTPSARGLAGRPTRRPGDGRGHRLQPGQGEAVPRPRRTVRREIGRSWLIGRSLRRPASGTGRS